MKYQESYLSILYYHLLLFYLHLIFQNHFVLEVNNSLLWCALVVIWGTNAFEKVFSFLVVEKCFIAPTVVADFTLNSMDIICTSGADFITDIANSVTKPASFGENAGCKKINSISESHNLILEKMGKC